MKRSEINRILKESLSFISESGFKLPPFAFWRISDWKTKGSEADEIRNNMLGWDITDFGKGNFKKWGLVLFTLRNGNYKDPRCAKPYAEKIMVVGEGQVTPMHYHRSKMEDIINRGGGGLVIKFFNFTGREKLSSRGISVSFDGIKKHLPAGGCVRLKPGESVSIPPLLYHSFFAEEGGEKVMAGEVSMVNDDKTDNFFLEEIGRFPEIDEDEEPYFLLCNEYPICRSLR